MHRQNSSIKEPWTDEDKSNYGLVLRSLRDLDILVPRHQVIDRLQHYDVRSEVRDAAISKWRKEISAEASRY
jgi:hypothetical protein